MYLSLVAGGVLIQMANGVAYLSGMVYGFFANKHLAFRGFGSVRTGEVVRYIALHGITLLVNVWVNWFFLAAMSELYGGLVVAFLFAISVSMVLNFLGLKYWVFRSDNI